MVMSQCWTVDGKLLLRKLRFKSRASKAAPQELRFKSCASRAALQKLRLKSRASKAALQESRFKSCASSAALSAADTTSLTSECDLRPELSLCAGSVNSQAAEINNGQRGGLSEESSPPLIRHRGAKTLKKKRGDRSAIFHVCYAIFTPFGYEALTAMMTMSIASCDITPFSKPPPLPSLPLRYPAPI